MRWFLLLLLRKTDWNDVLMFNIFRQRKKNKFWIRICFLLKQQAKFKWSLTFCFTFRAPFEQKNFILKVTRIFKKSNLKTKFFCCWSEHFEDALFKIVCGIWIWKLLYEMIGFQRPYHFIVHEWAKTQQTRSFESKPLTPEAY